MKDLNYILKRDPDTKYYGLYLASPNLAENPVENSEEARIYNLNSSKLAGTPDFNCIENFASILFFYSILDKKINTFHAVPNGYLASFNKENENFDSTVFIDADENSIKEHLLKLFKQKESLETDIKYKNIYNDIITFLLEDNVPLVECAMIINYIINENENLELVKKIENQFNKMKETDDKNCDDNHELFEKKGIPKEIVKEILKEIVVPEYLTYRGFNRAWEMIPGDSTVLEEGGKVYEALSKYDEKLSEEQINCIIGAMQTDCTAPIVGELLDFIQYMKPSNEPNIHEAHDYFRRIKAFPLLKDYAKRTEKGDGAPKPKTQDTAR